MAKCVGQRLMNNLANFDLAALTESEFLDALLNTKLSQILAESAVGGWFRLETDLAWHPR